MNAKIQANEQIIDTVNDAITNKFVSPIEKSVDRGDGIGYNNNDRSEKYEPTDEFRSLQAESKGMSDEERQFYLRGGTNETVRGRISTVFRRQMDSWRSGGGFNNGLLKLTAKGNDYNIYENVNGSLFHDVFEIARNYLQNGELVDLHEIETTKDGIGYNDCYNYLSEDGLSGFSITPDGDLISVFNASGKSGFLRAISDIVKEKAKTLDCYVSPHQNLMEMYERTFGFKTASVMDYNMEFDHDDIAENHGSPQIAFMVNTEQDVETRKFSKDEYDKAVEYRNSFVETTEEKIIFSEEAKGDAQQRVTNIARLLDKDLKVLFVDKNSVQLKGTKGKFIRKTNTLFISKEASIAEAYVEVFKHEFVHRLETRRWYQSFKDYLYNKSSAFEQYVRGQLKQKYGKEFKGTRQEAIKVLTDYYFNEYTSSDGIAEYIKNSFTQEDAEREIVADFAAEVLFKGKKYKKDIAFALAEEDMLPLGDIDSSIDALEELARTDRNLFQKIWDAIKDLINSLMGRPQAKNITADLEYLENRLKQVYDSADTKKAAKKAGEVKYSLKEYSKHQIENWKNSKRIIVYESNSQYREFIEKSKNDKSYVKKLYFGAIPTDYADFIEEKTGINIENYNCTLESEKIRKIFNDHGEINKEKLRGQKPVIIDDILNIPDVLINPTDIVLSEKLYEGKPAINFVKNDGNIKTTVTAVVSDKHLDLFVQTMYINKKGSIATPTDEQTSVNTPETTRGTASTDNRLSQNKPIVNTNISDEADNYSEIEENEGEQHSIGSPMQKAKENFAKYKNGEMTEEEYQESLDELWGEANEKYGSFPQGEKAVTPIAVPKAVDENLQTRRFVRTFMETGKLTEDMINDTEQAVLLGDTYSYAPISDEKAIKKAERALEDGSAERQWITAVETRGIKKPISAYADIG